jgi:peptidoglycan/xylan/chitin deacetylase (PgdA/CDA1 family)/ketosteroid isomerase-like protein
MKGARRTAVALACLLSMAAALRPIPAAADDTAPKTAAPRPILITVDDLPIGLPRLHQDPAERERITRGLLAALARHRVPAVGFVIWGHVADEADRALLGRWLDAGHELGNHTKSHPGCTKTPLHDYVADVEAGRAGLQSFLDARGAKVRFFRYPYLQEGDTAEKLDAVRRYLDSSGQRAVPVTIDDEDWSFEAPFLEAKASGDGARARLVAADYQAALRAAIRHHEATSDALLGRTAPQVLLLHANAVGASEWDRLFTWLEESGHRFARADEVLADDAFARPPRFVAVYGCGLWDRIAHEREEDSVRSDLVTLLAAQSDAWTRGDLDAFCSIYADDALYLSPGGEVRGRAAVLARYRGRYPDRQAMGTLRLEIEEVRPIWGMEILPSDDAVPGAIHGATVVARWSLTYPDRKEASGRTLLVFRRVRGRWEIVQDASM